MASSQTTTIAALATAPAPAGIAVVRVSGPQASLAINAVFRSKRSPLRHKREMILGELIDYQSNQVIDRAMAVYMPGPHSFTGEDVVEFQFHGSMILVQKILRSLFAFGAVPAENGEFSKRAFLNGKLDLIQAEAIADLINASNERALKVAGEQLEGRFSQVIEKLAEPLRDALAELEAGLDFPEEQISPKALSQIVNTCKSINSEVSKFLDSYSYGIVLRDGYRVLLCGKPNAGKSSLLNLILDTPRAIVSEQSGTTRDVIEESVLIAGYRFTFCDSAGIHDSHDVVEKMGIELAFKRLDWADLVLFVVDASDNDASWKQVIEKLRPKAKKIWMVTNKIDLNPTGFTSFFCDSAYCARNFYLSAKSKEGLTPLIDALVEEVGNNLAHDPNSSLVITNERQRNCLVIAQDGLNRVEEAFRQNFPVEIIGAELRHILGALEELIGKTFNEDILGRIFSKFCIGK